MYTIRELIRWAVERHTICQSLLEQILRCNSYPITTSLSPLKETLLPGSFRVAAGTLKSQKLSGLLQFSKPLHISFPPYRNLSPALAVNTVTLTSSAKENDTVTG